MLAFVTVVAATMLISSFHSYSYYSRLVNHQADQRTRSDLQVADLLIKQKKQSLLLPARVLSKDIAFNRILAGRVGELVKVRVKYFLSGLSEKDMTYMTVTDRDGIVLFRSRAAYSTGDDMSQDPVIRAALEGREITTFRRLNPDEMWQEGLVSSPIVKTKRQEGLVIQAAVPVFALGETGEAGEFRQYGSGRSVAGVICVGYLLNTDRALLVEIGDRTRGVVSIYFQDMLVNSSDRAWGGTIPSDLFKTARSWRNGQGTARYRGRGESAGYLVLRGWNDRIEALLELRRSTAWLEDIRKVFLRDNFIFILIIMAVTVALGLFFTRRITEPVMRLKRGAEEIGSGNLLHKIDIPGDDEIAELADAFNDMSVRLFRSMEEMRLSKQQIEDYSQRLRSAHTSLEMYSRELEKVNQELLISNINLQKANEVKDTFLSTVSHELKTPLTTILGYVSMILEGALGDLNEDQRESLEVVHRRGRNLQSLISDLLSLSRIDAGRLELHKSYVDIGNELRGIEEVFSESLKEQNLVLKLDLSDDLPYISADRDRINQVLFNLVGNAVKFTPAGGSIGVKASFNKDSNEIEISVSDTGIGIDEDEKEHIFERFYQVDKHDGREFAGTGLGLAISKEIVELHGGRIEVESSAGNGSTFRFTIPRI